jgi:hypothetical protein
VLLHGSSTVAIIGKLETFYRRDIRMDGEIRESSKILLGERCQV